MTENVKSWFIPRFETEVKQSYQQDDSRLGDTTAGGGTFIGDKCYFPRMGAVDCYDNERFARLRLANGDQDFIEVDTKPNFIAFGMYDPDASKYSINTAVEYGKSAASAIKRSEDRAIISALTTAMTAGVPDYGAGYNGNNPGKGNVMPTIIGDYNTVSTMDDVADAIALLGENEAFEGEDVTIVTPFRNKMQYALDPINYKTNVKTDMPWDKLKWRNTQLFPVDQATGGRLIAVYARSAVVSAWNETMRKIDERDGRALTDIAGYWNQVGAAVRDAGGVVFIKTKGTFSLSRYAQPYHAV
jgi:hypothetical protein